MTTTARQPQSHATEQQAAEGLLLNFAIIGAQKSGTSSLAHMLRQHPQVCFSVPKEPHFFSKSPDWRAGLQAYHQLFAPLSNQICGEASTSYTFLPEWPEAAARLHAYNPDIKLIYLMRCPVDRCESQYAHELLWRRARNGPEWEVALNATYINRSRYAVQIRPYLQRFPRQNIMLLVFEDFMQDLNGGLHAVANFLGIEATAFAGVNREAQNVSSRAAFPKNYPGAHWLRGLLEHAPGRIRRLGARLVYNTIPEKPRFSPALRGTLWRMVEDDVEQIEALLGKEVGAWRRSIAS